MPNRRCLERGRARSRRADPTATDGLPVDAVHEPGFEPDDCVDTSLRTVEQLRQAQEIIGWEESWPFDAWPEEDSLLRHLG